MKTYNCPLWEKTLSECLEAGEIEKLKILCMSLFNGYKEHICFVGTGLGKSLCQNILMCALDELPMYSIITENSYEIHCLDSDSVNFNKLKHSDLLNPNLKSLLINELQEIRKWVLL